MNTEAEHLKRILLAYCELRNRQYRYQRYSDANRVMKGGLGPPMPPPVKQKDDLFRCIQCALKEVMPDFCLECGRSPCACEAPIRQPIGVGGKDER